MYKFIVPFFIWTLRLHNAMSHDAYPTILIQSKSKLHSVWYLSRVCKVLELILTYKKSYRISHSDCCQIPRHRFISVVSLKHHLKNQRSEECEKLSLDCFRNPFAQYHPDILREYQKFLIGFYNGSQWEKISWIINKIIYKFFSKIMLHNNILY